MFAETMPYSARFLIAALLALSPIAPEAWAFATTSTAWVAQTPAFSLPETLPTGTSLSVQSSPNLGILAQTLKEQFEADYDGTTVDVTVTSSDQALAVLLAGDIDLAAIGRPLTEAEIAQGLVTVPLERTKIAVIIGPNNPYAGDLTFEQFAGMFRGEITNWAEVGGAPGPIRFVDRPEISDTRRSLSQYEVFQVAPFESGATTDRVSDDDTAAVIRALGADGISYAIAPHVLGQSGVTIVPMHQTQPDDPNYPYSQPRYFVYRDEPTPAVAAFLGYITSPQGAAILGAAEQLESEAVASALAGATIPAADAAAVDTEATGAVSAGETAQAVDPEATDPNADTANTEAAGVSPWWWLLLPIAGLAALIWALTRNKGSDPTPATSDVADPPLPVGPAPAVPPTDPLPETDVPPLPVGPAASTEVEPVAAAAASQPAPEPAPIPEVATAADTPAAPNPPPPPAPLPTVAATPPPEPASPPASTSALGIVGMAGAAGAAGLATSANASLAGTEDQSAIEASKFNVVGRPADGDIDLSDIDDGLPPLPSGYGESRIVLMPRDPQWAYAYWDTPNSHKEELRHQGGERLALRFYDVTDVNLDHQAPHSMQQFDCDELAREWYMQIPVSDRDYQVDIGYLTSDGRWLVLARSNAVRVPPVYPSDWSEDHFMTVSWDDNLQGKTLLTLVDPRHQQAQPAGLHEQMYALSQTAESQRLAGSLFGSMQHVPGSMAPPISSYGLASGMGMAGVSGGVVPTLSGVSGFIPSGYPGPTLSCISGLTFSGVGFSASMPPIRPRQFWLVADAELIVYGATEPDATVTISGMPIQLSDDGTFRFQMSFPDGLIEYPIMAVAADGEQNRSIHMTFERRTPHRHTNTRDEAQAEWPEEF